MSEEIIETIYGKYYKYEIKRDNSGVFSSTKFYIYRDGKYYNGTYKSLADAVADAVKASQAE